MENKKNIMSKIYELNYLDFFSNNAEWVKYSSKEAFPEETSIYAVFEDNIEKPVYVYYSEASGFEFTASNEEIFCLPISGKFYNYMMHLTHRYTANLEIIDELVQNLEDWIVTENLYSSKIDFAIKRNTKTANLIDKNKINLVISLDDYVIDIKFWQEEGMVSCKLLNGDLSESIKKTIEDILVKIAAFLD